MHSNAGTDAGTTDAGTADPSTRPQLLRQLRIGNKRRVREQDELLQCSGGRWHVPGRLPHRLLPAGSHPAAGSHAAAQLLHDPVCLGHAWRLPAPRPAHRRLQQRKPHLVLLCVPASRRDVS